MVNKVYKILKNTGLPVDHLLRPDITRNKNMVISYHLFNETSLKCGDGNINCFGGSLQVDLFAIHRVDFTAKKDEIKQLLLSNGFKLQNIDTNLENVDGIGYIDHVIFTFNYKEG